MRALALFSGGLDSILAAKLLLEQGIEVVGVCFESPFFSSLRATQSARTIGLPLRVEDITERLIEVILNPRHGYGKGVNPCIDCHALMLRATGEFLEEEGANFIITGEVLGQRPMSQNLRSLSTVAHDSGFKDLILRPLSAKKLPETLPEKKGWVMRERLLGLSGRSRKPQIELAANFGIKEYPAPAGGCLLTEKAYSRRMKDLISFDTEFSKMDAKLLRWGRHFRVDERAKIVVGRDEKENETIGELGGKGDTLLIVESFPGPTVLATGHLSSAARDLAASITVSYSDAPDDQSVAVLLSREGKQWSVMAKKKEKDDFRHLMI